MKHVLLMTLGVMCCLLGLLGLAAGDTTGIGLFFLIVGGVIIALRYKKWRAWYEKNSLPKKSLKESLSDAAWKNQMAVQPVSARIIGTSTKAKTGSAVGRAFVGDAVAGLGGAIVGATTAKNTGMTKFLVTYADGHKAVETVKDNSLRFKELIKVLED